MPNPDFSDPRNTRRDRKGQQRLPRHSDDLAGTVSHGPQSGQGNFEQPASDPQTQRAPLPQRDAGAGATDPLEKDDARTAIRARFPSWSARRKETG
jgi:hypothetical protein